MRSRLKVVIVEGKRRKHNRDARTAIVVRLLEEVHLFEILAQAFELQHARGKGAPHDLWFCAQWQSGERGFGVQTETCSCGLIQFKSVPGMKMRNVYTSRPARPVLCNAELLVISRVSSVSNPTPFPPAPVSHLLSLHFPVSMTYRTPGIVILVSAMFVARMTLRVFFGVGWNILPCAEGGIAAYNGRVNTY